ncbi:hypothetical protein [Spirosoma aerolatum]|uniref:hypothetical protein n=1 Tax=Spirosoma aerolatum TaxID=1211326 RepID=UPI0009ADF250|nr:hypothetical protein [Spirosoma aerolatum]
MTDVDYINRKPKKLLNFGSEAGIWVFSSPQQVMIAGRAADSWLTMDWHRDLELLDRQLLNIGQYLSDEGITMAKP